jgi:hypothetical protein
MGNEPGPRCVGAGGCPWAWRAKAVTAAVAARVAAVQAASSAAWLRVCRQLAPEPRVPLGLVSRPNASTRSPFQFTRLPAQSVYNSIRPTGAITSGGAWRGVDATRWRAAEPAVCEGWVDDDTGSSAVADGVEAPAAAAAVSRPVGHEAAGGGAVASAARAAPAAATAPVSRWAWPCAGAEALAWGGWAEPLESASAVVPVATDSAPVAATAPGSR